MVSAGREAGIDEPQIVVAKRKDAANKAKGGGWTKAAIHPSVSAVSRFNERVRHCGLDG